MTEESYIEVEEFEFDFAQVPKAALRDKNISLKAKGLYAYLFSLPKNWRVYRSKVLEELSDGKDSLNSAFKELEKFGYIISTPIRLKGQFMGYKLKLLRKSIFDTDKIEPMRKNRNGKAVSGKTGYGKPATNNKDNSNIDSINTLIDIKESCCFDDFWNLYGKKVGKKPCEKVWKKIKLDVRKVIFERLPKWKLQFTNSQFYPNPETFLQDERWNDEILGEPVKQSDQEDILSQINDIPSDIIFNKLNTENKVIVKKRWTELGHKYVNTGSISYCGWYLNNGTKVTPR